jgi:hypothetical protein
LILSSIELPSIDSQLSPILNQRIQRSDIDRNSKLKQLTEISYVYFSNVQFIYFDLICFHGESKYYANIIMKILTNFQNLKSLLICIPQENNSYIKYLNIHTISKNYQVKHFPQYSLFLKREFNDSTLTDQTVTLKESSFFSRLFHWSFRKKES